MAGILNSQFGLFSFVAYGETSIYGTDTDATLTIVTPKERAYNNVTLAFKVQAPEGYSLKWHPILFEKYLFSGCVLDYDEARVVDTLWTNWNHWSETFEKEYESLLPHSFDIGLTYSGDSYIGNIILPLSEGAHNVTVWVRAEQNYLSFNKMLWAAFSETSFTIDKTAPKVSVLSPALLTYNMSDVLLMFSVDEETSRVAYSLDGQANVTVTGNTTLSGLSGGEHSLKVCAWDEAGNVGGSEPVTFIVAEPFPTALVAVAVAVTVTAVVGVGLLFYFKKRKH